MPADPQPQRPHTAYRRCERCGAPATALRTTVEEPALCAPCKEGVTAPTSNTITGPPDATAVDAAIEQACAAWWDVKHNGKLVATIPWSELREELKEGYRIRMRAVFTTLHAS